MSRLHRPHRLLALAAATALSGCTCETQPSAKFKTGELFPDFTVVEKSPDAAQVRLELTSGKGSRTYVELSGVDALFAISGAHKATLQRVEVFDATWYEGVLPLSNRRDVTVTLQRALGNAESRVTMPATFGLSPISPSLRFSLKSPPTLRWSPSSTAPLSLTLQGGCIAPVSLELSVDSGELQLPPLEPNPDSDLGTCVVEAVLRRREVGVLDPAYLPGGRFEARVERSLRFTVVPPS